MLDMIETLKLNHLEQLQIHEKKILSMTKRLEQQSAIISRLLEEKKKDKMDIIKLEKKLARIELDNSQMERNYIHGAVNLTTEGRDSQQNSLHFHRAYTEASPDVTLRSHNGSYLNTQPADLTSQRMGGLNPVQEAVLESGRRTGKTILIFRNFR